MEKKRSSRKINLECVFVVGILAVILGFLTLAITKDLEAMPAFARKYQTSCVTCHSTFPRLNSVGESFRLRGFRFPDDEMYRKIDPLELGDEAYKKIWPNAIWPTTIPGRGDYFSATAWWLVEVDINNDTGFREGNVSFVLPHEAEIMWAGPFGENVTMYGDVIYINEDNAGLEGQNDAWIMGKAWIEFGNLFGPERMFNLRLGTIGIHTIGLFTARDEHGIGMAGYEFNGWMVPWAEWPKEARLVSDDSSFKGNTFLIQPQPGIELHGYGKNWLYTVGVANGNIEKPSGGDPELFDYSGFMFMGYGEPTDKKDFFGGFTYKIGGLGYDGSGSKKENLLVKDAEYWRDDSLTISAFGYYGNAKIRAETWDDPDERTTSTLHETNDEFWRAGVGVLWKYKDLELQVAGQRGHDEQPYGVLSEESLDVDVWFVESTYYAYPWLIPYARFESVKFDGLPEDIGMQQKQDRDILFLGCKAHVYANISVTAEYTTFTNEPDFACMTDGMLMLMLTTAF